MQPQPGIRLMPNSMLQIIGALSVVVATTAAMPTGNKDNATPADSPIAASIVARATAGPGLPADFPLAPGLSACKPTVVSGEVICEWHGVDGHAVYTFYHDALPKAGYTLLPGALEGDIGKPSYRGGMGFKKGTLQGAVSIVGGNVTIQILLHE